MDKVIQFIKERGHVIMLTGFVTTLSGVMSFMIIMNYPMFRQSPYARHAAMVLVFIGLAVYVTGRISVAAERRRAQLEARVKGRRGRSDEGDEDAL